MRHERLDQPTPTQEAYSELQHAFSRFNAELFAGELPPCLITLQRKEVRCAGYYSAERFGDPTGRKTDEIAINPMHFRPTLQWQMQGLQTLVHEMCHMWQQHCGTPSRKAYHNAEWAAKMEAVGLMPSDTGKAGGKKTGQKMADYPIAGGLFEKIASGLLDGGFRFTWRDRAKEAAAEAAGGAEGGGEGEGEGEVAAAKAKPTRIKFTCTGACGANAWGKPGLMLLCGVDQVPFAPAE